MQCWTAATPRQGSRQCHGSLIPANSSIYIAMPDCLRHGCVTGPSLVQIPASVQPAAAGCLAGRCRQQREVCQAARQREKGGRAHLRPGCGRPSQPRCRSRCPCARARSAAGCPLPRCSSGCCCPSTRSRPPPATPSPAFRAACLRGPLGAIQPGHSARGQKNTVLFSADQQHC